jgi:hypothetical protein
MGRTQQEAVEFVEKVEQVAEETLAGLTERLDAQDAGEDFRLLVLAELSRRARARVLEAKRAAKLNGRNPLPI